jgi:hypothetical protein
MKSSLVRSAFMAIAAIVVSATAQAQTYRCSSGGSAYLSDRPCGAAPATGRIGSYGPQVTSPSYTLQAARPSMVEAHVKYLGTECASISEGIRTAGIRGVNGHVVQDLHQEYRQKCALEDQDARRKVQADLSREQGQRQAQRDAASNSRAEAQQQADRCAGMRDVIGLKRAREASLNEKEVAALRALESTFNAECLARR